MFHGCMLAGSELLPTFMGERISYHPFGRLRLKDLVMGLCTKERYSVISVTKGSKEKRETRPNSWIPIWRISCNKCLVVCRRRTMAVGVLHGG